MKKIKVIILISILEFFQLFSFGQKSVSTPDMKIIANAQKSATSPDLKIIANNKVPESEMGMNEIVECFRGEKLRWSDRSKVTIAVMKTNNTTGQLTAEQILGMTPSEMDKYYLMNVFQGKISAPKTFNTESQLVEFVSETPGAIGIVMKGEDSKGVKVIKIK